MKIAGTIILWLFTLFLALIFIRQGLNKFPSHGGWAIAFAKWHFPVWFRYFIGVIELAAGILILWPRTASIAAVIIVVVMLGGMATHIWWHQPEQTFHEAMPLVLGSIVAVARRRASVIPLAFAVSS